MLVNWVDKVQENSQKMQENMQLNSNFLFNN